MFDLTRQPWIPVFDRSGRHLEVALTDALVDADAYVRIAGETPTQTVALLRLLLAVVHTAADPATPEDWQAMWHRRALPREAIRAYLETRRDRFDLGHPETPFYQVGDLSTAGGFRPPALVVPDVGAQRGSYTTIEGAGRDRLSFAEAARWLLHCHAYDPSGIKGAAAGDPRATRGKVYQGGLGALGRMTAVYLEGATLAETLLLNLVPASERAAASEPDLPVWDRPLLTAAPRPQGAPAGLADLYTWQSRRIRFDWDEHGAVGVLICQGDRLDLEGMDDLEPMALWRLEARTGACKPVRYRADRPVWHVLSSTGPAPLVYRWITAACLRGLVNTSHQVTVHHAGIAYGTKDTVIDDLGGSAMTVPAGALGSEPLTEHVRGAVNLAERGVQAVTFYLRGLAAAAGHIGPVGTAVHDSVADVQVRLDAAFREWIGGLAAGPAPLDDWSQTVRRIAAAGAAAAPIPAAAWSGRRIDGRWVNAPIVQRRLERTLAAIDTRASASAPYDAAGLDV